MFRILSALIILLIADPLLAANIDMGGISISVGSTNGADSDVVLPLQILALMTVLSLAPAILIMATSFTRIIVVLAMLRMALGTQQTPSNTVLISLALFLTLFTMMPVLENIKVEAFEPYSNKQISTIEASERAGEILKQFMLKNTREKDLLTMVELSGDEEPATEDDVKFSSLLPAFLISELQTAFQIGFVIFLPFLLVDLVVASVLMSMGMILLPPLTISLPVKILMFVLVEGWVLVVQALVGSFVT